MREFDFAQKLILQITMVGSTATCNPPPTDTDIDFLALISGDMKQFETLVSEAGFEHDGSEQYESDGSYFRSFRKGSLNLIFTNDSEFHRKFLVASSVAKKLNLLSKDDRITLFKAVLYGDGVNEYPEFIQAPIPYSFRSLFESQNSQERKS